MTTYQDWLKEPVAQRYFRFLQTNFTTPDGKTRQIAKDSFVDLLTRTHECYRPKFDLGACVRGEDKSFKGKVWFWSDLHISHANIIGYCNRPFSDVKTMNDVLIKNCLNIVGKDDILVIGGDVTMKDVTLSNVFLRSVPAYTILVLGNHDADKNKALDLEVDEMAACLEFDYRGKSVFVTHYPMDEQLLDEGQVNLHGHIHNTAWPQRLGSGRRHANMSVETIIYRPRQLHELLV